MDKDPNRIIDPRSAEARPIDPTSGSYSFGRQGLIVTFYMKPKAIAISRGPGIVRLSPEDLDWINNIANGLLRHD